MEKIIEAEQRAVAARKSGTFKALMPVCVGPESGSMIHSVAKKVDNVIEYVKVSEKVDENNMKGKENCVANSTAVYRVLSNTYPIKDSKSITPAEALYGSKEGYQGEQGGSLRQKRPLGVAQMNGQDSIYQSLDRAPKVPRLYDGISGPGSVSVSGSGSGTGIGSGKGTGTVTGCGSGSSGTDMSRGLSDSHHTYQSNPSNAPSNHSNEDNIQPSDATICRSIQPDDEKITGTTGCISRGIRCERLVALDVMDDPYARTKSIICFPAQNMRYNICNTIRITMTEYDIILIDLTMLLTEYI